MCKIENAFSAKLQHLPIMQRTMLSLAAVAAVASASAVHPERAQQIKQIQAAKPLWNASAVSRFASQVGCYDSRCLLLPP